MKKLYVIGGTMGVGKTAVCQNMKQKLNNCVFLDGDWCWDAHPFHVTQETKQMVLNNICFLLNQFIHCSAYETVIFCWVLHEQRIIDRILSNLDVVNCEIKLVSLVCNSDTLRTRLKKDIADGIRTDTVMERSVKRLPLYDTLSTRKVCTDNRSIDDIANAIIAL